MSRLERQITPDSPPDEGGYSIPLEKQDPELTAINDISEDDTGTVDLCAYSKDGASITANTLEPVGQKNRQRNLTQPDYIALHTDKIPEDISGVFIHMCARYRFVRYIFKEYASQLQHSSTPLCPIVYGSKTTIYSIPETADLVVKLGSFVDICREYKIIREVRRACRKTRTLLPQTPILHSAPSIRDLELPMIPKVKQWVPPRLGTRLDVLDITTGAFISGLPASVRVSVENPAWERLKSRISTREIVGSLRNAGESFERRWYCQEGEEGAAAAMVLSRLGTLPEAFGEHTTLGEHQEGAVAKIVTERPVHDNYLIHVYLGAKKDPATSSEEEVFHDKNWHHPDGHQFHDEPTRIKNVPGYLGTLPRLMQRQKIEYLARQMALGYAVLHWGVRVDGRGVDFLLASNPEATPPMIFEDIYRLHMLDFKECRPFVCWTREAVKRVLVPAVLENGPYIPRPAAGNGPGEEEYNALWDLFRTTYLAASAAILDANAGFDGWDTNDPKMLKEVKRGRGLYDKKSDDGVGGIEGDQEIFGLPGVFIEELGRAFIDGNATQRSSFDENDIIAGEKHNKVYHESKPGPSCEDKNSKENPTSAPSYSLDKVPGLLVSSSPDTKTRKVIFREDQSTIYASPNNWMPMADIRPRTPAIDRGSWLVDLTPCPPRYALLGSWFRERVYNHKSKRDERTTRRGSILGHIRDRFGGSE